MYYLRIRITGPLARKYFARIDSAVHRSRLCGCLRPDPDAVDFEVITSDEEMVSLLDRLWNIDPMGSRELEMHCERIPIDPTIDPGSGPRALSPGLVSCEECQALRCDNRRADFWLGDGSRLEY